MASSTTWANPVAPSGCPRPTSPPLELTTSPGAVHPGVPGLGGRSRLARPEEPERFEGVELLGCRGVVQLDQVEVVGPDSPCFPRRVGGLGEAIVVVDQSISGAGHRTDDTGSRGGGRNRRARHDDRRTPVGERAAHETGEDSGHLWRGQHLLDGRGALALGQGVACRVVERLDGGRGHLARGHPPILHQPLGPAVVETHQNAARRVVVGVTPVVQIMAVVGRQAVFDPGHGLGPIARPHLLDPEGQDRPVQGGRDQGGQVQR